MADNKSEKRRTERYDYPSSIEYVLDAGSASFGGGRAVTINISTSGMSVYVFSQLKKGQDILVQGVLPVGHRAATICWIKQENGNMYKTGIKFKGQAPGSGKKPV